MYKKKKQKKTIKYFIRKEVKKKSKKLKQLSEWRQNISKKKKKN